MTAEFCSEMLLDHNHPLAPAEGEAPEPDDAGLGHCRADHPERLDRFGTDQFDSRGCVEDYTRWVHLVAAMLRSGFTTEEAIAGGNYMRIFRAAVG